MADVKKLAVVGAGQMGAGIAQVGAQVGLDVVLVDVSPDAVEKGLARIRRDLDRQVKKGRLTEPDRATILARLRGATRVEDAAGADFAIEAVTESEPTKKDIFKALDGVLGPAAILATNTSSISVTRIATVTRRPAQVIGMHFMNPVPAMKLVELVRGAETSDATFEATHALAMRMGKTTVATKDYPAFIVNRLLIPYLNEACFALMENLGTVQDIDTAMKLGTNVPMGPLELADFIGLDTVLSICNVLHQGMGDDKYRPSPLLRRYVDAGWLGRKAGRGFYQYDAEGNKL